MKTYKDLHELSWSLHKWKNDKQFNEDISNLKGYADTMEAITTMAHLKTFLERQIKKLVNTPINY